MDNDDRSYRFHATYSDVGRRQELEDKYGPDWETEYRGADFIIVPMGEDENRAQRKARDLAVELDTNVFLTEEKEADGGQMAYRLVNIFRKPKPE